MKQLGFLLFLGGLTVASWFASKVVPTCTDEIQEGCAAEGDPADAVITWASDAGPLFAVGIALMVLGGVLARRAGKPASTESDTAEGPYRGGASDAQVVVDILDQMSAQLDGLDASDLPKGAQPLADSLDSLLSDRVPNILDRRDMLVEKLGLEAFAEMIGHFATMERGAARAWSAITDEAWDEVGPSLERARRGIRNAREVALSAVPEAKA
ncbi:MAG: hypothetical protein AAGE52_20600 [Myxococcota bacterium]